MSDAGDARDPSTWRAKVSRCNLADWRVCFTCGGELALYGQDQHATWSEAFHSALRDLRRLRENVRDPALRKHLEGFYL